MKLTEREELLIVAAVDGVLSLVKEQGPRALEEHAISASSILCGLRRFQEDSVVSTYTFLLRNVQNMLDELKEDLDKIPLTGEEEQ